MRAFAAVYSSGGVRAAAKKLGVSHSAVSRHLKELQASIGAPLFMERTSRQRLEYTSQGHVLGKVAVAAFESLHQSILSIEEARRRNAVIISTTASVAVRWLIPRLAKFQQAHRSIEVSVLTEQAASDPQSQGADFALRMGHGPWPDVVSEPIMDDALYPVVHPKLFESLPKRKRETFASFALIHDRDPEASWGVWFQKYPDPSVDLRRGLRFTSSDLVLRAAAQKLGIALARDRLVVEDIQSGTLMRPFGNDAIAIPDAYWIVTSKGVIPNSAVSSVISWLKSEGAKPS